MGICRNSSVRPDRMFTPEEAKESVLNTVKDIVSMEKYNDAVVTIPCRDKNSFSEKGFLDRKIYCYYSPDMRNPMESMDIQSFHPEDKETNGQCFYQKDFPLTERDLLGEFNDGRFSLYIEKPGSKTVKSMLIVYDYDKEKKKGQLEYFDFTKNFSQHNPQEQFSDHLRLALLMGNCNARCYDEGYDVPVDKVNWDIHIGNPVPPRLLEQEMEKITKRLEKEEKFEYSFELKEQDIVKMTEFRYVSSVEGIEQGRGSTSVDLFASIFASDEEKKERELQAEKNKKTMQGVIANVVNNGLSSVIQEMGLERKSLSAAFDTQSVYFYRKDREFLVIRKKENMNDRENGLYISGVLLPENEKKLRDVLLSLDNEKMGIQGFRISDDIKISENRRNTVLDLDGRQMPAYYEQRYASMKEAAYDVIKKETAEKGEYDHSGLFPSLDKPVRLYGDSLTYHSKDLSVDTHFAMIQKIKSELMDENKVEYSHIGSENRKGMLRDIAGKPHLQLIQDENTNAVILKDKDNMPVLTLNSTEKDKFYEIGFTHLLKLERNVFDKYKKEIETVLENKGEKDVSLVSALQKGISDATREIRREWAVEDYMTYRLGENRIGKEFHDVITDKEVFAIAEQRKNTEKEAVQENTTDRSNEQTAVSYTKTLTAKQNRMAFAIEKWAKENNIRNKKGYLLSLNRKSENQQAALNLLVKQAKANGWGKEKNDAQQTK